MSERVLKVPVQVRLPIALRDYLAATAKERRETQSEVVAEALNCLRERQLEALMEEGYRKLGKAQQELIEAGLAAAAPIVPR